MQEVVHQESVLKTILPLIGVFVGWLLGLSTNFIMIWWKNRELKKSLLEELLSIVDSLENLHLGYARSLQHVAIRRVELDISTGITHPIYENHYGDICHRLTREQRQSYEIIHGLIDLFNKRLDVEGDAVTEYSKEPKQETFMRWASQIEAQYVNVRVIHWHCVHHINNATNPALGFRTATHAKYIQFRDQLNKDVVTILENAQKLNPADADEIPNWVKEVLNKDDGAD